MRKSAFLFLCLLIMVPLLMVPLPAYADSGDFMEGEVQVEPPGFLERAAAAIVNNLASALIWILGLKDINALVYQSDGGNLAGDALVYHTFPASVWDAIDKFYGIFSGVAYYLLAIAIMAWAVMALFRAGDADGQLSLREMAVGVLIYVIGMYLAGHLIRLFFLVNDFIIAWSVDVLRSYGYDPYKSGYIGEVITRITDSMEFNQTIGGAIIFLVIAFVVAALNYQYVVRLLVMSVMIVLLPLVLFSSIFPASRRAFDIWVREFAVQAWLPAAHAIAFSLFFAVMSNRDPSTVNFIMVISMLLGLASVGPLMRMVLGAPGGMVSGSLGFGSVAAITMMLRNIRGRSVKATSTVTPAAGAGMPNMNTNMAQGLGRGMALGAAASGISGASVAGGITGAMAGRGDLLKSFGAGVVRQGVGMATGLAAGLAATAMTGNMEAGVLGSMRGHQLGKNAAGKAMNFTSGLYGHLYPYKGEKAPYDIISPGNAGGSPQSFQPPPGVLPSGMPAVASAGMHPEPDAGGITSSGGMGEHVRPVMNQSAGGASVNQVTVPEGNAAGMPVAIPQQAGGMTPVHGASNEGQVPSGGFGHPVHPVSNLPSTNVGQKGTEAETGVIRQTLQQSGEITHGTVNKGSQTPGDVPRTSAQLQAPSAPGKEQAPSKPNLQPPQSSGSTQPFRVKPPTGKEGN